MSSTLLSPLEINGWFETTWSGLAAQISGHAPRPLILVDGAAGSGKTTLASRLVDILEGNLVHIPDGTITHPIGNCEGLHGIHL